MDQMVLFYDQQTRLLVLHSNMNARCWQYFKSVDRSRTVGCRPLPRSHPGPLRNFYINSLCSRYYKIHKNHENTLNTYNKYLCILHHKEGQDLIPNHLAPFCDRISMEPTATQGKKVVRAVAMAPAKAEGARECNNRRGRGSESKSEVLFPPLFGQHRPPRPNWAIREPPISRKSLRSPPSHF